jgi:hypothetical protein
MEQIILNQWPKEKNSNSRASTILPKAKHQVKPINHQNLQMQLSKPRLWLKNLMPNQKVIKIKELDQEILIMSLMSVHRAVSQKRKRLPKNM